VPNAAEWGTGVSKYSVLSVLTIKYMSAYCNSAEMFIPVN